MSHTDFVRAFRGARFRSGGGLVDVTVHEVGDLRVRSGRITACDPLSAYQLEPLARSVPPGDYPVRLAVAQLENGDQRVAAAMIRFAEPEAERWELATLEDEDVGVLEPGQILGYGVDAGTGCFVDGACARALDDEEVQERLFAALEETYVDTWEWANVSLGDGNVVAFHSGWGDGIYGCYWGFDETGQLVALATDFEVLVEPVKVSRLLPLAGPWLDPELTAAGVTVERTPTIQNVGVRLRSRRACEVELATATGETIPCGSSVSIDGDQRHYEFDIAWVPDDAQLRVTIFMGVRPLDPA